jgi:hypothetical protein
LPAPGAVAEIGYIRWLDQHTRLTVGRVRVPVSSPGVLHGVTHLAQAEGWQVFLNGELQNPEPLAFLDACYAGWATFADAVPELAKALTRTLAVKTQYDGWDRDEMDVHILEEVDRGPDDTRAPEPAGAAVE